MKPITGTFLDEITWDIPAQNWGESEWRREFDTMREAGIDTVIIIRAGLRDMAAYPSEVIGSLDVPDLCQMFLDEALRCGMDLFFGCYDSGDMEWEWKNWHRDWEINQRFIAEMHSRYGQHPAFHGWYIAPETCACTEGALEIYRRYSECMKEQADKPVLISPYYPSQAFKDMTPDARHARFADDWAKILSTAKAIDICAFQDGSCNLHRFGYPTDELERYMRAWTKICRENGVIPWSNVETFARDMPIKFLPIDWRILKRKMEIADPLVDKHITFEFSHFMSPNSIFPSARTLFDRYQRDILGEG